MSTTTTRKSITRVTVEEVRELLELIASSDPKHVDESHHDGDLPRYVVDDRPDCLVARVLAELNFSVAVLRQLDNEHPTGELVRAGARVAESRNPALRRIEPAARALLQYVQDRQDRGVAWGKAVRAALTRRIFHLERFDRERRPWLYQR